MAGDYENIRPYFIKDTSNSLVCWLRHIPAGNEYNVETKINKKTKQEQEWYNRLIFFKGSVN